MATFAFEARDATGRAVHGSERARDEIELDRLLRQRDLVLLTAKPTRTRRRRRKAKPRLLIDFCHHLATAVEAGIPILEGLKDLQDGGRSPIADEVADVARSVEAGQQLSEAMSAHPGIFSELVRSLVAAGEEAGNLDEVLRHLTAHLAWREDMRRRIVSAATYPCIVITGLVGLVVLLLTVVIPRFLAIFVELDVELPLATRALLGLDAFAQTHGLRLLVALALLGVAGALYVRTERGRTRADALSLRTPVLGEILSMIEMSRLAHNLGLLYRSGIPITRCLELAAAIVQNRVSRAVVAAARERVEHGESLRVSLDHGPGLPPMVARMVALGERTGNLEEALGHVASYYDREVPARIDRAIAFVNTGVIVVLGVTVGTVAFAVFVPMYRMMGNLNG